MKKQIVLIALVALSLLFGCAPRETVQEETPAVTQEVQQAEESTVTEETQEETDPYAGLTHYTSDTGISLYMA